MRSKGIKLAIPILLLVALAIAGVYLIKNPVAHQGALPQQGSSEARQEEAERFSLSVTEAVDYKNLSSFGLPAIVDYGSDSCVPCKQMAPVLEKMNEEMKGRAFIKFVDVWKYPEAASNVPVQVIPTQVLMNADGTPFVPSEDLASKIEFALYGDRDTGKHIFTVHQGGLTEEQMRLILEEMGAHS